MEIVFFGVFGVFLLMCLRGWSLFSKLYNKTRIDDAKTNKQIEQINSGGDVK